MTKSNTLEQSLKHASHVCRVINVMLTVLLIGAGLIWLTALVMSFAQLGAAGFDGMSLVAYIVLYGVLVLGVLAMLKLIFKDAVAKRHLQKSRQIASDSLRSLRSCLHFSNLHLPSG